MRCLSTTALVFFLYAISPEIGLGQDGVQLPKPDPPFEGKIGKTYKESESAWPKIPSDVAGEHPDKLKDLQATFDEEARKYNVYPLDDRLAGRFDMSLRPNALAGLTSFTYGPGVAYINEASTLNTHNVSFSITAVVEKGAGPSDGVIAATGGATSGWSLYVKDGYPTFFYNFFEVAGYRVRSSAPLPNGKSTVRVEVIPEEKGYGKPASVRLFVDGKQAGAGRVEKTVPMAYSVEGFDVGSDNISSVSPDYRSPFPFTGKIEKVTVEVR